MRFTVSTPNLFGHVIKDDHDAGESPIFDADTALCGAAVNGHIERARWVCGKCVAILIANRNAQNDLIDVLERTNQRGADLNYRLLDVLRPPESEEKSDSESETVVSDEPVAPSDEGER